MKERTRRKVKSLQNVIIRDDRVGYAATIRDVSKSGMSVKTEHVFPTFKLVDVLIKVGDKAIQLQGSVRWVKEAPLNQKDREHEMGLAILNPPQEFLDYFELAGD